MDKFFKNIRYLIEDLIFKKSDLFCDERIPF